MSPAGGDAPETVGERSASGNSRGRDEHEAIDKCGNCRRHLRRDEGSHRVADEMGAANAGGAHPLLEPARGGVERELSVESAQTAEPRKVDEEDAMSGCEGRQRPRPAPA
jgi:hypothetical protein